MLIAKFLSGRGRESTEQTENDGTNGKGSRGVMSLDIWDSYPFDQWIMAKIDYQAELKTRRFQIIRHLRPMLWGIFRNSLNFNDDFTITDEIGFVSLLEPCSVVNQCQRLLRFKWHSAFSKLNLQTFLVNRF